VYWFFFWKLPKRTYGKDIPAFSKEDEKKLLAERADDNITPTITFKTLLDNRVSSNMLPLQEYVFKKWYYKRVITLGDSAHKVSTTESVQPVIASMLTLSSSIQLPAMVAMLALNQQLPLSMSSAGLWQSPKVESLVLSKLRKYLARPKGFAKQEQCY
jgi:hypothetical protein